MPHYNIRGPPMMPFAVQLVYEQLKRSISVLERVYMFQVVDEKGQVKASYANRSEADTYVKASFPDAKVGDEGDVREGEIPIFDADDNEIGAIRVPRDTGSAPTTGERSGTSERAATSRPAKRKGKGSGPSK